MLALLSTFAHGCTATAGIVEVVHVGAAAGTGSPRAVRYANDVAAIAATFQSALALPAVEVPLVLFPNRRAFAAGLVERGYTTELAEIASGFDAIGGASAVLVNAQIVDRYERRRRIRLLAHELVHSMQYRLSGGTRGASEQWLREGFAEWVACRVAAHMRAGDFDELRDEALAPLSAVQPGTPPAPLGELSTFPQWARAQRQSGGHLYAQAFLGAELLIDTHGVGAVAEYFARFAYGTERRQAFADSFGMDLREFESVLQRGWHQAVLQRQRR
jgi:hypothetical protein